MNLQTAINNRDTARRRLAIHKLRGAPLAAEVEEAVAELQEICPHESVETTSVYHPGGYDYTDETIYTTTCSICEKVLKIEEKQGSRYG